MKMKLEPWQIGAAIGLIIGIIVSQTSVNIVAALESPAIITVIVFVLIGTFLGHFKKH